MTNTTLNTEISVKLIRDCVAIQIPGGNKITLEQGHEVYIMQILGGMFTVETEWGYLARIDGKDADALNQKIPLECNTFNLEDFHSIHDATWAILKTCYDPEISVNIVDLGLIYEIKIDNDRVNIKMTLTAPSCGMGEVICEDIKQKLTQIAAVKEVIIDLVFDPPWSMDNISETAKFHLGLI